MKKKLLITLLLFITYNSYSQINFENGYFIKNNDEKINCLIKNVDWLSNPKEFTYKLSDSSETKKISIDYIKQFEITEKSKYKRFSVNIDKSTESINDISYTKEPSFIKEDLFLKIIVEGKATLYYYENGDLRRFFYTVDSSKIEQLVFKLYKTPENEAIIFKNERYKQQLWLNLKCPTITMKAVSKIDYKMEELIDFFVQYNSCNNSTSANYENKQKRDLFNLSIRPGITSSSLSMTNLFFANSGKVNFNKELETRLGIEFEFILPFNNNKWALLLEPTYRSYTSKKVIGNSEIRVDYKSIEFPFGLRHYFFLNKKSKIFINALYTANWSFNSKIYNDDIEWLSISARNNLAFGLGYKYNNKYSLELRYGLKREILSNYYYWNSDYKTLSIIFGYTIF